MEEKICFQYQVESDTGYEKNITISSKFEEPKIADVCEMFLDFLECAGFSTEAAIKYFQ